jgi:hypothetical protein
MKTDDKYYEECVKILSELHEMLRLIIEADVSNDLSPIELTEETLKAMKCLYDDKSVQYVDIETTKGKKILH